MAVRRVLLPYDLRVRQLSRGHRDPPHRCLAAIHCGGRSDALAAEMMTARAITESPRILRSTRQPVFAGRRDESGEAGAVLDAQQEQRSAADDCGARVEHRVDPWVPKTPSKRLTWDDAIASNFPRFAHP